MKIICKYSLFLVIALALLLPAVASAATSRQTPADTVQEPLATMLEEVVVTKKRPKYSKKNNPAVDLLHEIQRNYSTLDPTKEPYYSYDRYEKITIGLNDFNKEASPWLSKQLSPIEDFIDTSMITRRPVLNLCVREKSSSRLSANPGGKKEIVKAFRSVGIDESFDQDNIQTMLEDVFREVDIFGNDIALMQNRFVSPLSAIASDYYKYFLGDTTLIDGRRCVELIFVPHNPESFSFNGSLYVDIDDPTRFIPKVTMRIPKALNLNFVNNIFIEQTFRRDEHGNREKLSDDMAVELQLFKGVQGFYTSRRTRYGNFSYLPTSDFDAYMGREGQTIYLDDYDRMPSDYWVDNRMLPLREPEYAVHAMSMRIDRSPALYWTRRVIKLLVTGYIPTAKKSKVDIGPVNTMLSFGSIEGARLRLGGMTTADLSPHWFARGFAAYGTKDRKWKYHGEVEYSFPRKKKHSREYPMNSIRLEHTYDIDMIGQHYLFTNPDNIFLSLKRMDDMLATYRRQTMLSWIYENRAGISLIIGVRAERQEATRWLPFVDGNGIVHPYYDQSALFVDFQYAPAAKFVQMASYRLPVNLDNWVLRLTHEIGPKGFLGADFTLNKTEISVQKRFWFSAFGYLDMIAKGGHIWNQVQYPTLIWPNANLSYTIQPESFALMNPMEFASDSYAAWDLTYWLNGALFNRIPGFNELKLREVLSFRGFFGRLSEKNNPANNSELFRFPADSYALAMTGAPYMELAVGLDNIFTILRVDYVWRLTYRNTPGAPNSGLRIALHFTF